MDAILKRRWWPLALAALAALAGGLGALALTGGGASASAQTDQVQLTRGQLIINQRISQAAVRRSNEALADRPAWAVVIADGRLVRSSGGVSVVRSGPGSYGVRFDRDLTDCAFTASQIQPDPSLIGQVGLSVDGDDLRRLLVQTADRDGTAADRNFTVQVTC
ncbi:MAG: hypothetical protein RIB67_06495 [Miltoncostaeaceae bacterium]